MPTSIKQFKEKVKGQSEFQDINFDGIKSFDDFHKLITIKIYGFENTEDFYHDSSCIHFLDGIKKPIFILNAANDPLLGENCYPQSCAQTNEWVYLEIPTVGGHVGFTLAGKEYSYIELRAERFINEILLQ